MRVALTGTPGTGKTTVSERVADALGLDVVHLSEVVERDEAALVASHDEDRDTREVDLDALRERFADSDDVLFEGHLAHHLPVDHCVVLRCDPAVLEHRLADRGYDDAKVRENAESEALDVVLAEALDARDAVVEIDTTDRPVAAVAEEAVAAVRDGRTRWGDVDWSDYLASIDVTSEERADRAGEESAERTGGDGA